MMMNSKIYVENLIVGMILVNRLHHSNTRKDINIKFMLISFLAYKYEV